MQGLKLVLDSRRTELRAECDEFACGDSVWVSVEEPGDVAYISGFACRVVADGMQLQCDEVREGRNLEFCRPVLKRDTAGVQFLKGGGIHKKCVHVRYKARRVAVPSKVLGFALWLEASATQMCIECLTIFDGNQTIHIDSLPCHAVCRQRMTANDKQQIWKAVEKIEQSLHFLCSLACNEAKWKRQSGAMLNRSREIAENLLGTA